VVFDEAMEALSPFIYTLSFLLFTLIKAKSGIPYLTSPPFCVLIIKAQKKNR